MKKYYILILFFLTLFTFTLKSSDIDFRIQSKLLLKIISYDKNYKRFGNPIKIGVSSKEMFEALKANAIIVKDRHFTVGLMKSIDSLKNYKVVYIDNNWKDKYKEVSKLANSNSCLIFCNDENFVESEGASVTFVSIKNKLKILVNLENSKKQGSNFSPIFLKITVIVGGIK